MDAKDLTFGVEIETIAPDSAVRNDGLRIGALQTRDPGSLPARGLDGRMRTARSTTPAAATNARS